MAHDCRTCEGTMELRRDATCWTVHHTGPGAARIEDLFGTVELPLPYSPTARPADVLAAITAKNEGWRVVLAPQMHPRECRCPDCEACV